MYMYIVQLPTLMYLIFAKKQRIIFLTHWAGGLHSALFLGWSAKPVPGEMDFTDLFELLGTFLMSSVPAVFSLIKNIFHFQ